MVEEEAYLSQLKILVEEEVEEAIQVHLEEVEVVEAMSR